MRRVLGGAAAALLGAGPCWAGGVERSSQSTAILFETGTYAELSFGYVDPSVSGVQAIPILALPAGSPTGDVSPAYNVPSLGFKTDLGDRLAVALVLDTPIGASVNYADPGYLYGLGTGSQAELDSAAVTAMLRYKLTDNFSLMGGLRAIQTKGDVALFYNYTMTTSTEQDYGYMLGAAWERPDIALRVALSYNSAITHDFKATESTSATPTAFSTEIPQSVNLEFQTGIAADTLLFGSVRWAEWSAFDVSPIGYVATAGAPLVSYNNDTVTYTLGVGRRFTPNFSAALTLGYEEQQGGFASNLGPTDGFISVGLGGTYTHENIEFTAGLRYIMIGDAKTEAPAVLGQPPDTTIARFSDNSGIGVGFKIAYNF